MELRIAEERQLLEGRGETEISRRASERLKLNTQQMSAEMSAFMKGVDEADKGRLEVRRIFLTFL